MAALMKKIRQEEEAAGQDVITLHAGDALTGTLFYTAYSSDVDIAWMNAAGVFDAMVLGNHEVSPEFSWWNLSFSKHWSVDASTDNLTLYLR